MKNVYCNECGAFLIDTVNESAVGVGVEVQLKGFVYKNACLFSDKYTSLYFCDDKCAKRFYQVNIPKTEKNIATQKAIDEMKKEIPQMAKDCAEGLAKLKDELVKIMRK